MELSQIAIPNPLRYHGFIFRKRVEFSLSVNTNKYFRISDSDFVVSFVKAAVEYFSKVYSQFAQ